MYRLPLKYFAIYIIFTLICSFFGPAIYNDYNKIITLIFMISFLMLFFIGYEFGIKIKVYENKYENNKLNNNIIRLLKLSILISLILIVIEFISILLTDPTAFSITKMGSNYLDLRNQLEGSTGRRLLLIIRFLTGFFRNVCFIIGMYKYNELSNSFKKCWIITIFLNILVNCIANGTQKFLGDILIYTGIVVFVKSKDKSKIYRKKIKRFVLICAIIFIVYFVYMQIQRYDNIGINVFNYYSKSNKDFYFDTNHIIFKVFGYKIGFGIALLITSYLSAGYYGLSLCLQLPFKWTYGIGSSYALSNLLNMYLKIPNMYENTYLNRMQLQFGRDGLCSWNTIFPWLASDLTFVGSILIFIPIASVYAICWKEIIRYKNPVSLLMFSTITVGLVFLPANNQLLHGYDGFFATIFTFVYWIFNHKKYNVA